MNTVTAQHASLSWRVEVWSSNKLSSNTNKQTSEGLNRPLGKSLTSQPVITETHQTPHSLNIISTLYKMMT